MRKTAFFLALALAGAAHAALPRVVVETPLAARSGPAAVAAPLAPAAPLSAPFAAPLPALASPLAAPNLAAAEAPEPPRAANPLKAAGAPVPARAIGDPGGALFDGGRPAAAEDPLLPLLLRHVQVDDEGGETARRALSRLLQSPSMRGLAQRFVDQGLRATLRFGAESKTSWNGTRTEIVLDRRLLDVPAAEVERDLPPSLAQELFGRAPWLGRAAREEILPSFLRHELHEANVQTLAQLADVELNGRLDPETRARLQDPAGHLQGLKIRAPQYAGTFSSAEMRRWVPVLKKRLQAAVLARASLAEQAKIYRSWAGAADHFESHHGTPAHRLSAVRAAIAEQEKLYAHSVAVTDAVVAEMERLLARASLDETKDLRRGAAHPLFEELRAESDLNLERLRDAVKALDAASPAREPARAEDGRAAITLQELERMYREDLARRPQHWSGDATGASSPIAPEKRALADRLMERVWIEDGGAPERGAALRRVFERMMESPTARALARRFIAEGVSAHVRFEHFEGSRVETAGGAKTLKASKRAETLWNGEEPVVMLNLDYLGTDADHQDRDLPPTLAHELFGHGLWDARAQREGVRDAFHRHELNEANAKLVGWIVDLELDGRLEDGDPWSYVRDSDGYLARMKLRLPYYAALFSQEELARPVPALEARLEALKAKRAELDAGLAGAVRATNAAADALRRLSVADQSIAAVEALLESVRAPESPMARALKDAATHPFFRDLKDEAESNRRRLSLLMAEAENRAEPGLRDWLKPFWPL